MLKAFFFLFFFIPVLVFAQQITTSYGENRYRIIELSPLEFTVESQIGVVNFEKIKLGFKEYFLPQIEGFTSSKTVGNPNLPILRKLIEIPQQAQVICSIEYIDSADFSLANYAINSLLMPRLASTPKNASPVFSINDAAYKTDAFIGENTLLFEELGTMRHSRMGRISVAQFKYNAVQNKIRVYTKIRIRIHFQNANLDETNNLKKKYFSPYYLGNFNGAENASAYAFQPVSDSTVAVKYVIVADSMFRSSLQSFIKWKRTKGFQVVEAYTSDALVGKTKASIRAYLKNLYDNASANAMAPTFVLLVGDTAQIPAFVGTSQPNHFTDLDYFEYTNDEFPEVMYGRFSANTVAQLLPQISKTIEYEKYLMADGSFLSKSILVAGVDNTYGPTHANGQINYIANNYVNAANGITPKVYLYPTSGSNANQIKADISQGAAIVNYTAHGSYSGWSNPSFSTSDIPALTNAGKYPLVITNACETNRFEYAECFTEALVRASNKGAVAAIGASNNTFWDEDFYWSVGYGTPSANPTYATTGLGAFDCMYHTHGEVYDFWAVCAADIIRSGNLAVTQSANNELYYWEIYHLIGDPSLLFYTKLPAIISPTFNPIILPNIGYHDFSTVPYALVAVSRNDTLIGSAYADYLGHAHVLLPTFSVLGNVTVVMTAQNYKPYFGSAIVTNPTGPYLMGTNFTVNDKKTNNNGLAEYSEKISCDMALSNLTSFAASGVKLKIISSDTSIQILDSTYYLGNLSANSSINLDSIFKIQVKPFVTNGHACQLTVVFTDTNSTQWSSLFSIVLYAPELKILSLTVNDAAGNNNGMLDIGENAILEVKATNQGGCKAVNVQFSLTSSSPFATINGNILTLDSLSVNGTYTASFPVSISNTTFLGSAVNFNSSAVSGLYLSEKMFTKIIGAVNEDFETGTLTKYPWSQTAKNPWQLTQSSVYQGFYSAKSRVISNQDTSSLNVEMFVYNDDSISFYRMVSSEKDYDFLNFFIDNTLVGRWSGSQNWARFAFPVSAGQHSFKWLYVKDYYGTSGSDGAQVDMISFPANDNWLAVKNLEMVPFSIQLFPNPSIDVLHININAEKNSPMYLQLYNLQGVLVKSLKLECTVGSNSLDLEVGDLSSGIYNLMLRSNEYSVSKKVIVLKNNN